MPKLTNHTATFEFHAKLRDFLRPDGGGGERRYDFNGNPSVKDAIEAQGVPHPEVELILLNDAPADFTASLAPGDRVAVFPAFHPAVQSVGATLREPLEGELRFEYYIKFYRCADCGKVYWKGSHYRSLLEKIRRAGAEAST